MNTAAFSVIPSQQQICARLADLVSKSEPFILLTGDSGSGRTVVLEQLVSAVERKIRAVYVPCRSDMSLARLRETLLKQLLPGVECSSDLNLADNLVKHPIPGNDKILIIADDADTVLSSFFTELTELYQEFLGQNRFAFVLSGKPLWTEQKLNQPRRIELQEVTLPPLSGDEAMGLCRQIFKKNAMLHVYNNLEAKLPAALAKCKGNISKIIQYTGLMMTDQKNSNQRAVKAAVPDGTPAKKRSSAGIFITVVCIIIALACLSALFIGGNYFDSKSPDKVKNVQTESPDGSSLSSSQPVIDDGALNSPITGGIEAETPPAATQQSITLSGEELQQIEEAGSNQPVLPRPGVAGSEVDKKPQTLNRTDNSLRQSEDTAAPAAPAVKSEPVQSVPESKAAAKTEPAAAVPVKQEEKAAADNKKPPAETKALAVKNAAPAKSTASAAKPAASAAKNGVILPENVPFSGQAVPGGSSELALKNDAHYTVQVVAGRNKAGVVQVSAALSGRYWIYQTERDGAPWYVLIVGEYPNRAGALDAASKLPAQVKSAKPFIKSFGAVKQEMARAQ